MTRTRQFFCYGLLGLSTLASGRTAHGQIRAVEMVLQKMLSFPVRVVNAEGQSVAGATVIPWALRSSQGHGMWKGKKLPIAEPPKLVTDADGRCEVPCPRYTYADELVATLEVTLSINHPDYAFLDYQFVNVPYDGHEAHLVKLERGVPVYIVPIENGKPASLESLRALWSDGRSWGYDAQSIKGADGELHIPPMPMGKGQLLLVRLDGDKATHFSQIIDLDLEAGQGLRQQVELQPAVRIVGKISDDVPRPVKNGRLKFEKLAKDQKRENVSWFSWAPIAEDGSFSIDRWPDGEPLQIIALAEGWMAASGKPPEVAPKPPEPDSFNRPQVFMPDQWPDGIRLQMTRLVRCEVETVDGEGQALAGIEVGSWPNVGWWNDGSQIYCSPLVRRESTLDSGDYLAGASNEFGRPFNAISDAKGRADLELPQKPERLVATSNEYELPVDRGSRSKRVELAAGETAHVRLVMQPKGAERLGDWDKLAGVLFGCRGEQCRRLISDPNFRAQMDKVSEQLDAAAADGDRSVLPTAYRAIAAAFDELGDKLEAAKWRRKAEQEAAKLKPTNG
jgi:hypothetical protein